jgi:hypothetical protein
VEVAQTGDARWVRDSKDPDGPMLLLPVAAFGALVNAVKGGQLRA